MDAPGKDDAPSLRQQWMARWEKTGAMPQALRDEPEVPVSAQHIWRLYWDLAQQRSGGGLGTNPIDAHMIESHCRLMRLDIEPWEAAAIFEMEQRAYLPHQADRIKNSDKPRLIPAEPEAVAAVFRAMAKPKRKGGKK